MERLHQVRFAEGLRQALYSSLVEQARPDRLISLRGDEDDRDLSLAYRQFMLELWSGHTWHRNIKDQATGAVDITGRKELFRRCEGMSLESELSQ